MLQGKRFGFSKEVIAETETYFEPKDKSFYKKGIKMLDFISHPTNLLSDVLYHITINNFFHIYKFSESIHYW